MNWGVLAALGLVGGISGAPEAAPVPTTPASTGEPQVEEPAPRLRVAALIVASESPTASALLGDLRPRVPGLSLHDLATLEFDAASAPLFAFVRVHGRGEELFGIDLVLSDGRAYSRTVQAGPEQASRAIAGAIANLVAAIDEDVVAPDREDVPLPDLEAPTSAKPEVAPPATAPREGEAAQAAGEEPAARRRRMGPRAGEAAVEGAVHGRVGPLLGLAPAPADLRAIAGGLAGDLRLAGGALVTVDLRLAGVRRSDLELLRGRVAIGGGYGIRRRRFDFPIVALLAIEPWGVRAAGERLQLAAADGTQTRGSALFGLGVRLSPGYRRSLGGRAALRVGFRGEVGASSQLVGGAKAVRILPAAGEPPTFRLGGLEAEFALEVGLTFGGRPRADTTRARARESASPRPVASTASRRK